MLGKNPTSVQNAIMLAKKKDAELCIIKGLHNHDSGHEINNIYPKHNDKPVNIGLCHTCNDPHLIKNYNESTCGTCNLNLDSQCHLNALENAPLTSNKVLIPFLSLITVTEKKN